MYSQGQNGLNPFGSGSNVKFFALDQRLREENRIFGDADVRQQISMFDVVLDQRHFIARRNIFAPMPALFDVRGRDRQHVPVPDAGRKPHPGVRRVFGRMRASVHPDRPALLVRTDGLVDRDELMRDGISFLPNPHLERAAMDVFHDVNLALMLRQRETSRTVRQSPLPRVIVDRKADEFDQRRPGSALRFILFIWPEAAPIRRSDPFCPNAGMLDPQHRHQEHRNFQFR